MRPEAADQLRALRRCENVHDIPVLHHVRLSFEPRGGHSADFGERLLERIEATTRSLAEGLVAEARKAGVIFSSQSIGSMFGIYFRAAPPQSFAEVMQCDRERFNRFFHAMLEQGIYLAPSAYEAGFVSAAHGDAEIDATLAAARAAFSQLR